MLALRYLEDWSDGEIAAATGLAALRASGALEGYAAAAYPSEV